MVEQFILGNGASKAADWTAFFDIEPAEAQRARSPRRLSSEHEHGGGIMRATRSNPDTVAAPVGTYSQAVRVETGDAVDPRLGADRDRSGGQPRRVGRSARADHAGLREPRAILEGAHGAIVRRCRQDRDLSHEDARRPRRHARGRPRLINSLLFHYTKPLKLILKLRSQVLTRCL